MTSTRFSSIQHSDVGLAQDHASSASDGGQYLVFSLGEEHYAVDILKVQEIRGYENVTRIANAPAFIKGVTNLRGVIVPIVDLRLKFNLGAAEYTAQTVVIVINLGARVVGIVVDGVSDVISLAADQLLPPPEFGARLKSDFLAGLATVNEHMLLIMDIERMMTSEEMALMDPETAVV
ncbi:MULTISPECIES: chemotaxis protein CheW [Cobetia]|uniref:chemotaxis protein CheW n=1 Tax=Cobetia TaxID=204286 RepID=UPI0009873414|nr:MULTISPECIES: chemotaxis protein CheW [Cobetia]POR06356.1 chemotaxis protein CheW [Cobetia sp. MM1IDA2H-1]